MLLEETYDVDESWLYDKTHTMAFSNSFLITEVLHLVNTVQLLNASN